MAANLAAPVLQQEKNGRLLEWAERIIQQRQYETLETLAPRPLDTLTQQIRPEDVTCLFRVSELVFRRDEGSLDRFTTVLNALHAAGASCLMLLQCCSGRSELYLGAVNKQRYDNVFYMNTIRDILRTGIEGNLPGTELKEIVSKRDIANKLEQCLDNGFDSQLCDGCFLCGRRPVRNGKSCQRHREFARSGGQAELYADAAGRSSQPGSDACDPAGLSGSEYPAVCQQ